MAHPPSKPQKPQPMIIEGIQTNNPSLITHALHLTSEAPSSSLLNWTFQKALSANNIPLLTHLISTEGGHPLATESPRSLSRHPSKELYQLLLDKTDWDINAHDPDHGAGYGPTLLQYLCPDESMVEWLLDHGATPALADTHPHPYQNPPILERAASLASIPTFKLLQSHGAVLGPRTLHQAVSSIAGRSGPELSQRMDMVRFLVEELHLDVNALDVDVSKGEKLPNHWGTPLCYVAQSPEGGEEVVRYLLSQGADPRIRDCWDINDAVGWAEDRCNKGVEAMLRKWVEEHEGGESGDGKEG